MYLQSACSLLSKMRSITLNRISGEYHKKTGFSLLLTPLLMKYAELSNKKFIIMDSKLNKGFKLKFLY